MKTCSRIRNLALASAVTFAALAMHAQSAPAPAAPPADTPHTWTTEQIVTCTVHECWELSGKNETTFFNIVGQLAVMSAQKRGLTLPDTAEAGSQAGEYIKLHAKADPDQLLYALVDAEVRKLGK